MNVSNCISKIYNDTMIDQICYCLTDRDCNTPEKPFCDGPSTFVSRCKKCSKTKHCENKTFAPSGQVANCHKDGYCYYCIPNCESCSNNSTCKLCKPTFGLLKGQNGKADSCSILPNASLSLDLHDSSKVYLRFDTEMDFTNANLSNLFSVKLENLTNTSYEV